MKSSHRIALPIAFATLLLCASSAHALLINWVDWQSSSTGPNGFTALGQIDTGTKIIDVTYNNPRGVAFIQTSGGTDYYQNFRSGRNPATSAFTSVGPFGVDNIPDGGGDPSNANDIVALRFAGRQTLSFSEAIANPYFAYVSLNRNGYGFDQDFELMSFTGGNVDGNGVDDNGYWGCGKSKKDIVDTGGGVLEYQLNFDGVNSCGTEPHGVLRFNGVFDQVTWNSLSDEFWNGFTVGVQGAAVDVCVQFPATPGCPNTGTDPTVPEPGTLALTVVGLYGLRRAAQRAS